MTYTQKKAADVASALGMVHDRNARDLLEQLIREVIEDCAAVADWERGNWVGDCEGQRSAGYVARYIRMLPERPRS